MNLEKTYNGNYYCDCYKYAGCEKENGKQNYCTICQLGNYYHSYLAFSNYSIDYHIKLHIQLLEDLKENPNLEIYDGDYKSKSNNFQEGKCTKWSLYNYVFKSNYLRNVFK